MSAKNENSSEEQYSDSASESEEDTTTLPSDIGLEPYKFEPERKLNLEDCSGDESEGSEKERVEPQGNSRAGSNVWCKCDQCHCEKREIDCLCCKEVAALGDEKFAGNKRKQVFRFY